MTTFTEKHQALLMALGEHCAWMGGNGNDAVKQAMAALQPQTCAKNAQVQITEEMREAVQDEIARASGKVVPLPKCDYIIRAVLSHAPKPKTDSDDELRAAVLARVEPPKPKLDLRRYVTDEAATRWWDSYRKCHGDNTASTKAALLDFAKHVEGKI